MSEENRKTLAAYDLAAQKYLDNTVAHNAARQKHAQEKRKELDQTLRKSFATLPKNSKILEIGAADGANSLFLESLGYNVTASDVAPAFINALKKCELKTIKFNVLEDNFPENYDGVLCWRVFVHFTPEDILLALKRIFKALNQNGRLIFNVIDRATHSCDNEMKDFSGEYEMGAKRYYAYYTENEIRNIIAKTNFKIADYWSEKGGHNNWFCFVLEKSKTQKVNSKIQNYIESEILPKYSSIGGHTDAHIRQVIDRSLNFHKQAPELNIDMVYVIAAYHDLGRTIDQETHNFESAKLLRKDNFLRTYFSEKQINIMAEAVEDHRSTLGHEPRSIYGKLVSSADRNTNVDTMLSRIYDYTKHIHPEISEDEVIERSRLHLRKKYSPDGYAANTMYFNDPNFAGALIKVEEITRTPEKFAKIMRENNNKRF